jgi:hypothetical protein
MSSKKIGIVIHNNALLFSNGITQNAFFLYQCLEHCGFSCHFLCHEPDPKPFQYNNIPLHQIIVNDTTRFDPSEYNLILTMTRLIKKDQYDMFHSNGIPVVSIICGNHFIQDQEAFVHGLKNNTFSGRGETYDEIWTIPSLMRFKTYFETLKKVPVYQIPHLWNPCILKDRALIMSKISESELMYEIQKHPGPLMDIVIMEPNLGFVKNAWLPIIASECLYMKHSELINNVFVFNFPENPQANAMIQTLTLGNKLRPFTRLEMDQILKYFAKQKTIPIFLTHHNHNHLNFLYYELLHYGYPLIHNSDMLIDYGYYYEDNNIDMCVNSILKAYNEHNKSFLEYKTKSLEILEKVNPFHTEVCDILKTRVNVITK